MNTFLPASDLLKLNGMFTEGGLRKRGFSQRMINEAKRTGFFRDIAGVLVPVDPIHRERRLPRLTEGPIQLDPSANPSPTGAPPAPGAPQDPGAAPVPQDGEPASIQCPNCGSSFDPALSEPTVGDPAADERTQDSPAAQSRAPESYSNESLVATLLKNPRAVTESGFPIGAKVTKNVNGVAVPCVVTAVNGSNYQVTSTDGKNTPMTASLAELALIPTTPEEQQKEKEVQQKTAPETPQNPQNPTHNPLG